MKLFGIEIKRSTDNEKTTPSFVPRESDDGAVSVAAGGAYGTYVDLDSSIRSVPALINKYREMAANQEVDSAIQDIVNQAIVQNPDVKTITLNLDETNFSDNIKNSIRTEFEYIQKLLHFYKDSYKYFRQWYIDGRIYFHIVVDQNNLSAGIQELRYIDPRKIRKIRETKTSKADKENALSVIESEKEYYIFSNKGFQKTSSLVSTIAEGPNEGVKIAKDSVIYVPSGILDKTHTVVISHLHKAIKALNNLRAMEDAVVIYRICLVGDTRIKTESNTKYIKDIEVGDKVYVFTLNGLELSSVKNKWMTGVKPVYKVKSKHFEVTGTTTHPILVHNKLTNVVSYVPISELNPEIHSVTYEKDHSKNDNLISLIDYRKEVALLINPEIWSDNKLDNKEKKIIELAEKINIKKSSIRNFLYGNQYLHLNTVKEILNYFNISSEAKLDIKKEYYSFNDINLPEFIDEDFAELFGFLIGDGHVSKNTIMFAEGTDISQNEYYANLLKKYFGNCSRQNSSTRKYSNWTTNNTIGATLLKNLGYISGAKNKRIPEWVFLASDNIKSAFIRGLANADGHVFEDTVSGKWQAEIELCNKRLVEDIKDLWTDLGMSSGLIRHRVRHGGHICVDHVMPETESWSVFLSNISLPRFEKIISVEHVGEEEVYDIEVDHDKHNFIANGIVVHNSRAPERRIFYIDVGNLPKAKAEQYMNEIMTKFKNKLVYDSTSGEIRDDRRFQTMLEDFWLARREGGRGTEISTLPAGQNLGELADVEYFQRLLYKSLNVPSGRLDSNQTFNIGRGAEISRDEDKFSDFITRLRLEFSDLFLQALEKQLILKNIIKVSEWDENRPNIHVRYADNSYYAEIRENEIINMRAETLDLLDKYVGIYFSRDWVMKNILNMTEDDIKNMKQQIQNEREEENSRNLQNSLDNLKVQTIVHQQAQKDGVVIDPNTGEVMPPQLMPPATPPPDPAKSNTNSNKNK